MTERAIELEFEDVLQNIEFNIQMVDRETDDLVDLEVADALDALIKNYSAEAAGRIPSKIMLSPTKRNVYDAVRGICEIRMARTTFSDEESALNEDTERESAVITKVERDDGEAIDMRELFVDMKNISLSDMILCLKRIRNSVKHWNVANGRRGYIEFTAVFFPTNMPPTRKKLQDEPKKSVFKRLSGR